MVMVMVMVMFMLMLAATAVLMRIFLFVFAAAAVLMFVFMRVFVVVGMFMLVFMMMRVRAAAHTVMRVLIMFVSHVSFLQMFLRHADDRLDVRIGQCIIDRFPFSSVADELRLPQNF